MKVYIIYREVKATMPSEQDSTFAATGNYNGYLQHLYHMKIEDSTCNLESWCIILLQCDFVVTRYQTFSSNTNQNASGPPAADVQTSGQQPFKPFTGEGHRLGDGGAVAQK